MAKGASVISWGFLTKNLPIVTELPGGGIWPAIAGTLLLTGVAAVMAVPLGVLAAIYLNEYGRQRPTARVIRFMADVMTGVPSIVMGLFVALIWVSAGLHAGYSTFAGSLALGVPDVADRDPLERGDAQARARRPPAGERRARRPALADRARASCSRPRSPGIVSGAMLAVARAAGETAPLLFTIGISPTFNPSLGAENTALPVEIWNNAQQPFAGAQDRAWGAALTLITLVFLCTVIARIVLGAGSRARDASSTGARCDAGELSASGSSPRSHSRMRCSRSASRATRSRLRRNCGS